jgi:hypothetical protein
MPFDITTSANGDTSISFVQAFCDASTESLLKAAPSKSFPKKLVEDHITRNRPLDDDSYNRQLTEVSHDI